MRSKTLTKAHITKMDKLKAAKDAAINDVYAFGENGHIPFNTCYELANRITKAKFDNARRALLDFELKMVKEGRGYHTDGGSFQAYSKY